MKTFLESIGGLLIGAVGLICVAFLAGLYIKGGVWLSVKILPWLILIAWIVFAIDLLIVIPLGLFNKTKGISGFGLVISSYIYGLYLFCWSMLLAYVIWGIPALIIGLFLAGIGVAPVAMAATLFKGEWLILIQLIMLAVLTYGSRMLGFYLAEKADEITYEKSMKEIPSIPDEDFEDRTDIY